MAPRDSGSSRLAVADKTPDLLLTGLDEAAVPSRYFISAL